MNVFGDSNRIRQIIVNLLSNAIKFTDHGQVSLTVKSLGKIGNKEKFQFEVSDTGPGLSAQEQKLLFSEYEQTALGVKKGGSGLGLSICKQLVKLMNGHIGVESEKGVGTQFWFEISLPISSAEFCEIPEYKIADHAFKGHVLVAEDQVVNQKVIQSFLTKVGLKSDIAKDGSECLELFSKNNYDLVFMDCRMPKMDGYEATTRIRQMEKNKRTPIVALSAEGNSKEKDRCFEVGMDDFLGKPIEFSLLIEILRKHLLSDGQPVNLKLLKQLSEYATPEENLLQVLIEEYCKIAPVALLNISKACQIKDLNELQQTAHGLKSSSGALGMERVCEICQTLEDGQSIPSDFNLKLINLDREISRALIVLKDQASKNFKF